MIELGTRPTVVIQAAPFCFGPISTSMAVAEVLRHLDVAIVWLAEGTALELLQESATGDYVIPFSLSNPEHRTRLGYLVEEADLVLVNTDPSFAEFALPLNPQILYLDILYWMWDQLPAIVSRCALYIYEDFVRSDEQFRRVGLPPTSLRVGPLIGSATRGSGPSISTGHLLVSLGGLHRPGDGSSPLLQAYEAMVRESLVAALQKTTDFETVYLAGGGLVHSEVTLAGGVTLRSGCLSRSTHQQLLATAKAVVLAPGLTSFYEATSAKVPTFFLPPHNYSQYLQLQSYRTVLADDYLCDWGHLGVDAELSCFLPEDEMLEQVDSAIAQFVRRPEVLAQRLAQFLCEGWRSYDPGPPSALTGSVTIAGERGAERVAAEIVRRLEAGRGSEIRLSARLQPEAVPLPQKATLELFGGCQLRCPLCPTGARVKPGRPTGPMTLDRAARLIDELAGSVKVIELFSWGEPFLNPHACEIIRMIADRGIRSVVSTNLQTMPDPHDLLASGLSQLIVSCHGMTQHTYAKYMVGGLLSRTLANLDRLLAAAGPDPSVELVLRFVVFAHNEHELPLAYDRFRDTPVRVEAAPMRMDMRDEILNPVADNLKRYSEWIPDSSRFYDQQRLEARRAPIGCNLPFEEIVIDVDGSVSLCCSSYDPMFDLGNALRDSVTAIWNGPRYLAARNVVSGRSSPADGDVLCRTCRNNGYRDF
jgi:MoaA/NifB/PqqE/SkfB family radical SAM enzyme